MTRRELGLGPTDQPRTAEDAGVRLLPVEQFRAADSEEMEEAEEQRQSGVRRLPRRTLGPGGTGTPHP